MTYNILIIPIITGYYILNFSKLLKYSSQRFTRSRILFESVFIGIVIIAFGFFIRTLLTLIFPSVIPFITKGLNHIPIQKPLYLWTYVSSSIIAIIIFAIINVVINKYYHKNDPILWAVNKHGDELENLAKDSAEKGLTIQITLKSNKVYIGFCEQIPIPQKTNYLTISPILSGYRESETKKLVITTNYFNVVNEFINDIENNEDNEDVIDSITLNTDVIIKQDEILSAGIYEQEIYDKFNSTTHNTV